MNVCGCLSLWVDPAINWQLAQGVQYTAFMAGIGSSNPCDPMQGQSIRKPMDGTSELSQLILYAIFHGNLSKIKPMFQKWTAAGQQTCQHCHLSKASTIQRLKGATLVVTEVTAVEQVDSKIIGRCENLRVKTNWSRTVQISVRAGGSQELSW